MFGIFLDALVDSLKMVPLLLVIYIGIELVEYKFGEKIREKVQRAGKAGPLIGAAAGSLPQCGFSVVATVLYTERLATIGTLLAVYLATSDEAIPVILAQPGRAAIIIPLILTKVVIALLVGYFADLVYKKSNAKTLSHIRAYARGEDAAAHHHEEAVVRQEACCGHKTEADAPKFDAKEIILHPIIHTLKIFFFIFAVTFLLGALIYWLGDDTVIKLFSGHKFLQPIFAALVGLIPNCAASVALTELFLKGVITYGAAIAGLCASGGLGVLVLLREEKEKKSMLRVLGWLFLASITAGYIIQYLF